MATRRTPREYVATGASPVVVGKDSTTTTAATKSNTLRRENQNLRDRLHSLGGFMTILLICIGRNTAFDAQNGERVGGRFLRFLWGGAEP